MYEDLKAEIEKLKEILDLEKDKLKQSTHELSMALDMNTDLSISNRLLEKENEDLKEKIDELEQEVSLINSEEMENEEEIAKLKQENETMKKQITSLKKALEYTKKNKVNEDDDPFLPESQDVGGLDTV